MIGLILQTQSKVNPLTIIRDQFLKKSWDPTVWRGIVLVIFSFLLFGVILHFIYYYERQKENPQLKRNPTKLFRELMRGLGLNFSQREILSRMAFDLRLSPAAKFLLSPKLFQETAQAWLSKVSLGKSRQVKELENIFSKLYPGHTMQLSLEDA